VLRGIPPAAGGVLKWGDKTRYFSGQKKKKSGFQEHNAMT